MTTARRMNVMMRMILLLLLLALSERAVATTTTTTSSLLSHNNNNFVDAAIVVVGTPNDTDMGSAGAGVSHENRKLETDEGEDVLPPPPTTTRTNNNDHSSSGRQIEDVYPDPPLPPSGGKRLIILAGPHHVSYNNMSSVMEYFYYHATRKGGGITVGTRDHTNDNNDYGDVAGSDEEAEDWLDGWIWPRLEEGWEEKDDEDLFNEPTPQAEEPYEVYNHLVTSTMKARNKKDPDRNTTTDNDSSEQQQLLEETILRAIEKAWMESTKGIIIGAEDFDRGVDGINAMNRIVECLQIDILQDVTVVIHYLTPRLEQWVSLYRWEAFQQQQQQQQSGAGVVAVGEMMSYQDWICNKDEYRRKVDLIATQMNPLQLAMNVIQVGYRVSILDIGGIQQHAMTAPPKTMDVDGHHYSIDPVISVILCNVLRVDHDSCSTSSGTAKVVAQDKNVHNANSLPATSVDTAILCTGLSGSDLTMTNKLFMIRDCEFQNTLTEMAKDGVDNNIVQLYFPTWSETEVDCYGDWSNEMEQNPDIVYQALLSQVECDEDKDEYEEQQHHYDNSMVTMEQIVDDTRRSRESTTTTATTTSTASHDSGSSNSKNSNSTVTKKQTDAGGEVQQLHPVESWWNILTEAIVYATLVLTSILYQVYRMCTSLSAATTTRRTNNNNGSTVPSKKAQTATLIAEMTELTSSVTDLEAEYGDVDVDDDDGGVFVGTTRRVSSI